MSSDSNNKASGEIYAASLTPCTADLDIDHERLALHVKWLLTHGCTGVALMGTTGEANSFSRGQRMDALEGLLSADVPADKLMVGTGCCALRDTVMLTRHALSCGVKDILMLPPFYYKDVSDEGLVAYYERVMQAMGFSTFKLYLYHFPRMSQVPFSAAVVARLLFDYPDTIAGMKDSSGDWDHMKHVIKEFPELRLFTGTERHLLKVLRAGGAGCITATANVLCSLAARLVDLQDSPEAQDIQDQLTQARSIIEALPMVAALKELVANEVADPYWRHMIPPNVPLEWDQAYDLERHLEAYH